MPTVSVIIPSYNHEKFIKECIQSVLDQTFQDLEIIITDDDSIDHTVDVIESFDDPRIKLFKFHKNQGVSIAANNCIRHASGKYIAWLSSDDVWYSRKLAVQVKYLDEHPKVAVVFGKVDWIDEYGNPIRNRQFPYMNIYEVENRSRFEWLRHFFLKGNCLSLPCSLVRTECFAELGMFNSTYANIQDFDLWIRICHKADIHILDQKLIKNRWISDETNASGDNIRTRLRVPFEYKQSLNHYLQISDPDEFLLIFPFASKYGEVTSDTIPYLLGRIAIEDGLGFKMLWGLDVIYSMLNNEKTASILEDKCSFTCLDFIKLAGKCNTFRITVNQAQPYIKEDEYRGFLTASKLYIKEIFKIILQLLGMRGVEKTL
jgi:glycosyltransferase involved in cell wall biosynthesis